MSTWFNFMTVTKAKGTKRILKAMLKFVFVKITQTNAETCDYRAEWISKFWFKDNKTIKVKNILLKFVPFFNHLLEERVFEKVMIYANLGHVARVSCSVKTIWYRDSIEKVHHPKTRPESWTWEKTEPLKSGPIGKDWPQRLNVLPLISFYMKDNDDVIHFR